MRASRFATFLFFFAFFVGLIASPGCKGKSAEGSGPMIAGRPVETQSPNGRDQKPAFAGQTRAPYRTENVAFSVEVVAAGLAHPWSLAFLPDGTMLVTERSGALRIVNADGALSAPVPGTPAVDTRDQGGLLDVALDPHFADNHAIYLSFAERDAGDSDKNGTALARATLVRDAGGAHLDDLRVIWRQQPKLASTKHFGGRILFDHTGALLLTLGERSIDEGRHQAQRLDGTLGKIIRIQPDGTIPTDNPFVDHGDVLHEIWSYGHRNIQAAAWHPDTHELWTIEHGARGGDEVNVVEPGKDYGWPTISYGIEYKGDKIGQGLTQKRGMEQPIYYWDPVIAPSGALFYTGDAFPMWRGNLFVGALAGKHLARLAVDGHRIVSEERLLVGRARIRDVRQGPDGFIYVLTDEENGELLRLIPRG